MPGFLNELRGIGQEARQALRNLSQSGAPGAAANSGAQGAPPLALNLYETASVTLNGSGAGTARLSPFGPRQGGLTWDLSSVTVSVTFAGSAPVNESAARLYLSYGIQSAQASDLVAQSGTGSSGDTCAMSQTIRPGDWLTVAWSGGDAGQIATFVVAGTINPPGSKG